MNTTQDFLAQYAKPDELYHHGILGQKWGVRRYQNPDGSLTEEGRKRYGIKSLTFDPTKYTRKYGLVGGIVDLARVNKVRKEEAERDRKTTANDKSKDYTLLSPSEASKMSPDEIREFNSKLTWEDRKSYEYVDLMNRHGWSGSNKSDYFGGLEYHKTGKMGDYEVEFSTRYNAYSSDVEPELAQAQANRAYGQYQKQYKKVLSTTREQIAKDFYDNAEDYGFDFKMTRDQFKNKITPFAIDLISDVESYGNSQIVFNDNNLLYGHILTLEYNIDKDKAGRPSMDG